MDFDKSHFATEIDLAHRRIQDHIRKTPLEYSIWLSHLSNSMVYIKLGRYAFKGGGIMRSTGVYPSNNFVLLCSVPEIPHQTLTACG